MELMNKQLKELEEIDHINHKMLEEKEVFKSNRLFNCILGLNSLETNIFSYLLQNKDVSTSELTDVLDMDRSSIQRALQDLKELNIITRKSMSMKEYSERKELSEKKTRGYLYVYNRKDINSIKQEFKKLLDKWYKRMECYIEDLDNLFDCYEIKGELCSDFDFE
ncbi:MAG: helix-turn-helix domain-containing protein [Promethearchaeia archaeon]